MAETAQRADDFDREAGYPTALRLAAEPVADGASEDETPAADTYGLRAELEAQRRRAGSSDGEPRGDGAVAAPEPEAPPTANPPASEETELEPGPFGEEPAGPEDVVAASAPAPAADPEPAPEPSDRGRGQSFVEEARARLEALERSLVEKTDTLRQRAGEIAEREEALSAQLQTLDELEATATERQQALEARESELVAKLGELEAEAERLEEEQAIWGEATKESKTRLTAREAELATRMQALDAREQVLAEAEVALETKTADLEAALASRETELEAASAAAAAELEARHEARLAELDAEHAARLEELAAARAEVDERGASLVRDENDVREREAAAQERDEVLAERELALEARAEALVENETALEARRAEIEARGEVASEREAALEIREAGLSEREAEIAGREEQLVRDAADLESREQALAAEAARLEQERGDWDGLIHGAFDRLSELETDLVSSLSLAGMLKRELEGREGGGSSKPSRAAASVQAPAASNGREELAENRSFFQRTNGTAATPAAVSELEQVDAGAESTVAAENPDEKAAANDWWARQLGRRKKD